MELDKKRLHHIWTAIRPVKVWYLAVLLLISLIVFVVSMRSNNLTMVSLREEVYTADKNDGDVEGALHRLRSFVYAHMNTNLQGENGVYPPIQLKYTYQRLKQAEQARVQQANSQIYTDAQSYCEQLYPGSFSGGPRVPCIEKYVSERGIQTNPIPDALYKFDFASPRWAPDLAGFSLIMSVLLAIALVLRIAALAAIRKLKL